MNKESNMKDLMMAYWDSLAEANEALLAFINGGIPPMTEKRHKEFMRKWETMKEKASKLCDQIEKDSDYSIEPMEVVLPWNTESFKNTWQRWTTYLEEQHKKIMKSRMEYAALALLKRISDGKEDVAIEYLEYAMANGYPRFFKVTTKNYEQPTIAGGRGDGDY